MAEGWGGLSSLSLDERWWQQQCWCQSGERVLDESVEESAEDRCLALRAVRA